MSESNHGSHSRQSGWLERPDYRIDIEVCDRPVRWVYNDVIIADSREAILLREQEHAPVYYFPRQDVRMDLLQPSAKITFCPFKGEATHWSLSVCRHKVETAAWSYDEPFEQVKAIKGYVAFYPQAGELMLD